MDFRVALDIQEHIDVKLKVVYLRRDLRRSLLLNIDLIAISWLPAWHL
jgi:hypothetical protein